MIGSGRESMLLILVILSYSAFFFAVFRAEAKSGSFLTLGLYITNKTYLLPIVLVGLVVGSENQILPARIMFLVGLTLKKLTQLRKCLGCAVSAVFMCPRKLKHP